MARDWNPLRATATLVAWGSRALAVATAGRWRLPMAAVAGVTAGIALLALQVSNARSYLSTAPEACINCHVMVPYYAGWSHSRHRTEASCSECHVPHEGRLRALAFKAMDGLRHATIFTLRREPQVLRLRPAAVPVVQQSCIRCHGHQVMRIAAGSARRAGACWDCHRETPHGLALSLSVAPHARRPALPRAGLDRPPPRPSGVPAAERRADR